MISDALCESGIRQSSAFWVHVEFTNLCTILVV